MTQIETDAAVETVRLTTERRRSRWGDVLERYALVGVLLVIVGIFAVLKPTTYPTLLNAQAILSAQSVTAFLALAAMVPLIVGQFDVSVGFQLGLAQALCAGLILRQGMPAIVAALVAIVACVLVGVVNGLLVTRLRLHSFIVTLGTGTLVLGFTQLYSRDEIISGRLPEWFTLLGRGDVLGVPLAFLYVAVLAAILWFVFEYTPWGRAAHAVGGNDRAALLAGIRVSRVTSQSFVVSGFISGLSGCLSVMILGSSSPTVGLGELLPAFAAVFLGATAIRPGRFNALGTILAVYVLAAGISGLQQVGADFYVQQLFNGGALVLAVSLSAIMARHRRG